MKTIKKTLVLMLALLLTAAVLAGCGGGGSSVTDIQQNVTVGKRVYVDEASGVVFFGYQNLICTAKLENGEISEFIPEGGTTGNINAMAVYNDELYISANDGMFKYPLSMFTSGETKASATTLLGTDQALSPFSHFEISGDKIFFIYGSELSYITTDGGDRTKIADEVVDFEVSDNGIYYTNVNGDMMLMSPELNEQKAIGSVGGVKFTPGGAKLYYRLDSTLRAFSVEKEESEEIATENAVYEYCIPFSNGKNVLYCSDDSFSYYLVGADGEKAVGKATVFPFKADGVVSGDLLISVSSDYSTMETIDLNEGSVKTYDLAAEMKTYLEQMRGGTDSTGSGSNAGGGSGGSTSDSGDYDITDGMKTVASDDGSIEYIYFNDFMITMPNNDKWSMETSPRAVTFYLWSAQQEGYGGKLVSIAAYDMDDDTYTHLPSYHEAGITKNTNKRLIAEYPTDVQWNHDDPQQEADYKDLDTYLRKIGAGAVNSPLQTGDSD